MGKSYKPITSMKEVPEQLRKLRRQYLRYQQAEIIYSISHKKLLELVSDAGAIYRIDGTVLIKPEMKEGNPIRLYSLDEITEIFGKLGLRICNSFADFSGKPSSDNDIQLMVYSIRE